MRIVVARALAVALSSAVFASPVVALPIAAGSAQRGGGGVPAGEEQRPARTQRPPSVDQFEDLNPARMLVDRRKKLALADSQVAQLKAVEKRIQERNAPLLTEYDSVRKEMRFPSSGPVPGEMGANMGFGARGGRGGRGSRSGSGGGSGAGTGGGGGPQQSPEAMAKMRSQMQALAAIGLKLQERRPADVAESLALLTPDQAANAREFIVEQDAEFDKILPRGGRGG